MQCPKCKSEIGQAKYCGCGWVKRETLDRPAAALCSTAGCPHEARTRVRRTKAQRIKGKPNPVSVPYGGWLNLCHSCDDRRHREESIEYCKVMGLDTPEKQRAWCLKEFKRGKDMLVPAPREPGQDDEEMDFHPATQA